MNGFLPGDIGYEARVYFRDGHGHGLARTSNYKYFLNAAAFKESFEDSIRSSQSYAERYSRVEIVQFRVDFSGVPVYEGEAPVELGFDGA